MMGIPPSVLLSSRRTEDCGIHLSFRQVLIKRQVPDDEYRSRLAPGDTTSFKKNSLT